MVGQPQDEEITFSDREEGEELPPVEAAQGQRRVYSQTSDPTIEGLYSRFHRGRLVLQPEFQRGYVWDDAKASRLVESVLLDVPIPNFYLAEEPDGSESVIDGQQRLTSFFREELIWLLTSDQDFDRSLIVNTTSAQHVHTRFDKWLTSLKELLGQPHHEPRSFKTADKEALYNRPGGDTCAWEKCGQKIMTIDDAEVDHVEHYWRGGKTDLSNARLLHRYCNRKRGGGD